MSESKRSSHSPVELTEEEKQMVISWLTKHWGPNGQCYVCKQSKWVVGPHLITPSLFSEKGSWMGGPSYPQTWIVCSNCGHTVYFNAILMGLVEEAESEDEKESGDGDV